MFLFSRLAARGCIKVFSLMALFSFCNVANAQSTLYDSSGRQKEKTEKDGVESLDKIYPFKVSNVFYVSGLYSVPLKTHSGASGFGASVGILRGLLDLNVTYINESRVWRQLEQRSNEDILKEHRAVVTADDGDPVKTSRYATQFLWSESDPFELWSLDVGFGVRYPSSFLPSSFSNQLITFVSLGSVKDKSITSANYSTRGAGLLAGLNWRIPGANNLETKVALRYSILEASENGFKDVLGQLSLQEMSFLTGVELFL